MKAKLDHAFCLTATCQPGKLKTDYWNVGDPIGLVFEKRASGGATFYLRFQDSLGWTREPIFGREMIRPLAVSIFMASRTAVRLTP